MIQALNQLKPQAQHVLIDAMRLEIPLPQTKIIHGDARSESIAAASIVAKVTRDEMMKKNMPNNIQDTILSIIQVMVQPSICQP